MPTMRTGSGCLRAVLRVAGVLFVGQAAVAAASESVATALVVSVDVSQSVDDTRFRLQMEGIAEALEAPALPFRVGVQWHPETMEPAHRDALFGGFVAACAPA